MSTFDKFEERNRKRERKKKRLPFSDDTIIFLANLSSTKLKNEIENRNEKKNGSLSLIGSKICVNATKLSGKNESHCHKSQNTKIQIAS